MTQSRKWTMVDWYHGNPNSTWAASARHKTLYPSYPRQCPLFGTKVNATGVVHHTISNHMITTAPNLTVMFEIQLPIQRTTVSKTTCKISKNRMTSISNRNSSTLRRQSLALISAILPRHACQIMIITINSISAHHTTNMTPNYLILVIKISSIRHKPATSHSDKPKRATKWTWHQLLVT